MTDQLPAHLAAGSLTLSRMTTDELRAELAATLTVTARHLLHLAHVWRELERRGEDLSNLRSGLWTYMPLIARDELRAELVMRYAGYTMLLKRLTRLSLADQDRLVADDRVTIVEVTPGGFHDRHVSLARMKGPQVEQVIRDRIVSPEDQRTTLAGKRVEVVAPGARSIRDKVLSRAAARRPRVRGRAVRTVGLSLSDAEWAALKHRAATAGLSVARLLAGALEATGLLDDAPDR